MPHASSLRERSGGASAFPWGAFALIPWPLRARSRACLAALGGEAFLIPVQDKLVYLLSADLGREIALLF